MSIDSPLALSILAVLISLSSFGWTLYTGRRDRPRLVISSYPVYGGQEDSRYCVVLRAP
jgi:hypothetical protein